MFSAWANDLTASMGEFNCVLRTVQVIVLAWVVKTLQTIRRRSGVV